MEVEIECHGERQGRISTFIAKNAQLNLRGHLNTVEASSNFACSPRPKHYETYAFKDSTLSNLQSMVINGRDGALQVNVQTAAKD